jgi:hypothetical protein
MRGLLDARHCEVDLVHEEVEDELAGMGTALNCDISTCAVHPNVSSHLSSSCVRRRVLADPIIAEKTAQAKSRWLWYNVKT